MNITLSAAHRRVGFYKATPKSIYAAIATMFRPKKTYRRPHSVTSVLIEIKYGHGPSVVFIISPTLMCLLPRPVQFAVPHTLSGYAFLCFAIAFYDFPVAHHP